MQVIRHQNEASHTPGFRFAPNPLKQIEDFLIAENRFAIFCANGHQQNLSGVVPPDCWKMHGMAASGFAFEMEGCGPSHPRSLFP